MDVTLQQLRYFVAVAERLHFTEAAQSLFVSQPALSKQIRALESLLDTSLFLRDRRHVELTAAGEALLPSARQMLTTWATGEQAVRAVVLDAARTLVIGMSTGVDRGVLPATRARFSLAAPDAKLNVVQVPWSDPSAGLLAISPVHSDAAFVWLPQPEPDSLRWITVATETRLVALPLGHPLGRQDSVSFADLRDETFLALPPSAGVLRSFWLADDLREGRAASIGAVVSSTEETVEAVAAGQGVVLFASGNARLLSRDDVVLRPVTGVPPCRLVFAWRRDDNRQLLTRLCESVAAAVRSATHDGSTSGANAGST